LRKGDCKTAPSELVGDSKDQDCYRLDITNIFDHKGWAKCTTGYYIKSIYSTKGSSLHNIEELQCCKPKVNNVIQGVCYDQSVSDSFDKKGWSKCRNGTYMAGMWRNDCDSLHCIERFKCCGMKKNVVSPGKVLVSTADWWTTFDHGGWSKCPAGEYMTGLYRSSPESTDRIGLLEEGECKSAPLNWASLSRKDCHELDLKITFDKQGWGKCKPGYYMSGMYSTKGTNLHNIENFQCCRPNTNAVIQGSCYQQDVKISFDNKGWSKCKSGTYMTGLYRGTCDWLYCIESFNCCAMKHV